MVQLGWISANAIEKGDSTRAEKEQIGRAATWRHSKARIRDGSADLTTIRGDQGHHVGRQPMFAALTTMSPLGGAPGPRGCGRARAPRGSPCRAPQGVRTWRGRTAAKSDPGDMLVAVRKVAKHKQEDMMRRRAAARTLFLRICGQPLRFGVETAGNGRTGGAAGDRQWLEEEGGEARCRGGGEKQRCRGGSKMRRGGGEEGRTGG